MVTFPFDDDKTWCGSFERGEFISCLDELLSRWEKGLEILENVHGNVELTKLKRYAEVVYVNLKSTLVQLRYNIARENANQIAVKEEILALLKEERVLAQRLYRLASKDACVGYEASSHYYFTQNHFLEKFITLETLIEDFSRV